MAARKYDCYIPSAAGVDNRPSLLDLTYIAHENPVRGGLKSHFTKVFLPHGWSHAYDVPQSDWLSCISFFVMTAPWSRNHLSIVIEAEEQRL